MIRHVVESRPYLSLILTVGIGALLSRRYPFPDDNAVLCLVAARKPMIFLPIRYAYQAMLFTTPFIASSVAFSLLYIFVVHPRETVALAALPTYPKVADRDRLFLVAGELHHPKRPEPTENPQ